MISVHLIEPGYAYTLLTSQALDAGVNGGGIVYAPEQYCADGGFEGSVGSFVFWKDGESVESPASTTEIDYSQARTGESCVKITINDATEKFVTNIYGITKQFEDINGKALKVSFWAKSASAANFNLYFEADSDGGTTNSGGTPPTIAVSSTWTKYEFTRTYTMGEGSNFLCIGISKASGTGTILIDDFEIEAPANLTETPIASYVTLSPGLYYSPATSLVGKHLVFTNGNNKSYGSVISAVTHSSDTISRIDLAEAMPYAPAAGHNFWLLIPNTDRFYPGGGRQMISVTDFLMDGVTVESTVQDGFSKASFDFDKRILNHRLARANILGWTVIVQSPYGLVWEGYVASYSIADYKMSVDCLGFKTKLSKLTYAGSFSSNSTNTTPVIIKDILSTQPEIVYSDETIDREDALHTVQVGKGGIGPMDFTTAPVTANDALDKVLRLGAYGDDTLDELMVQVWDDRVASMKRIKASYTIGEAKWHIDASAVSYGGMVEIEVALDRSDLGNVFYGTYSGEGGETLETPGVYFARDVMRYGISEKQVTSGSLGEGEMHLVLEIKAKDAGKISSISDISVSGDIHKGGQGMPMPAYLIRAGDVVYLADPVRFEPMSASGELHTQAVVAGEVSIDLMQNKARITPYKRAERVDTLVSQIEINTGGE